MENLHVWDSEDLLSGSLLAPMRLDSNYDEADEDYTGEVYLQPRSHRVVFMSGGMLNRCYGGPEEGGWWYDGFDPQIEVAMTVYDVQTLRTALGHVEALLRLRNSDADERDLKMVVRTGRFYRPGRPYYE